MPLAAVGILVLALVLFVLIPMISVLHIFCGLLLLIIGKIKRKNKISFVKHGKWSLISGLILFILILILDIYIISM